MTSPSPSSDQPTPIRWLIFGLACAASFILYLHRYSWGVIKPALKRDYPDLTDQQLGWLDSAFNATYALGQVPTGLAGDLFGARSVLSLSVWLWSAMVVAVALVHGFWLIAAVRAVFGLAQAGTYPVLGQVTRSWFPLAIRTSIQGTVTALGRVGGACASLVVATVLMGSFGLSWRSALVVLALPGFLLAVAVSVVVRSIPQGHPWTNAAEQQLIERGEQPVRAGAPLRLNLTAANVRNLSMLLFYSFNSTFADMLYVNWIPLFLVEAKKMSSLDMGIFAMLPLLGGAVGGVVGGMLNDGLLRLTGNRRWSRSGVAFTGKVLAAGLIALSVVVADGRLAMVVLLACKFFGDWSLPTLWGTITDLGGRASATLFGLVNTVGAIGAVVAGPVMGYLKETFGWEGLFHGVAAVYLAAAVAWLFIDCTRRLVVEEVIRNPTTDTRITDAGSDRSPG